MNETSLLTRVQELLDDRVDPFDDPEVLAALDAHPEWLPRLAGLRGDALALAALAPLPVSAPLQVGVRRQRRWWIAFAGATLVAAGLWFAVRLASPPPPVFAGRIVASRLTELRPRAHLAATFVVSDAELTTPTSRLHTWELRSERR